MEEFFIWDTVWHAQFQNEEIREVCDICFWNKEVTVILWNKEEVIIQCSACDFWFSWPSWYTDKCIKKPKVVMYVIDWKEITESKEGSKVSYNSTPYCFSQEDIFNNEINALARAEVKAKKEQERIDSSFENCKKWILQKLSWSISYYRKKIKDAERTIKHANTKIKYIKTLIN